MKKSAVLCTWRLAKPSGRQAAKNESAIHWDMINDMTREGKIYADGELFYENGKFKEEILKEILRKRKYRKGYGK